MKSHRHEVFIHWGDTDPAKIVFYPNYYKWFDESTLHLFESVGFGWNAMMEKFPTSRFSRVWAGTAKVTARAAMPKSR